MRRGALLHCAHIRAVFRNPGRDFYFGLGTEIKNRRAWKQEELHPATGDVLRVKADFVKPL